MSDLDMAVPLTFTDAAANKVKSLISEEEKQRIKITRLYYRWRLQWFPNTVSPLTIKSMKVT